MRMNIMMLGRELQSYDGSNAQSTAPGIDWPLCTLAWNTSDAGTKDAQDLPLGATLATLSGVFLALSMSVQRYALSYPTYDVFFIACRLPRPVVWCIGFAMYFCANGLFAMSSNLTPLTLNATLFTLLLVWNLIFSRIFLGEHAGAPRTFGAVLIVIGAAISVLGTPTTARNQFGVNDIGNLVKTVIGAIYLILQIGSGLIAASAVVWFERTYTLGEQEQEVRRDRTKSLAYNVIFDGKASIALGEHPSFTNTPAQTRWQTSGRKLIEKLQVSGQLQPRPNESPFAALVRHAATHERAEARDDGGTSLGTSLSTSPFGSSSAAGATGCGSAPASAHPSKARGSRASIAPATIAEADERDPRTASAVAEGDETTSNPSPPPSPPPPPPSGPPAPTGAPSGAWRSAAPLSAPPAASGSELRRLSHPESIRLSVGSLAGANASSRRPSPMLEATMAVVYPMSLGLLEGVTQNTVKALTAIWFSCKEKAWPSCCLASGWTWAFFVVFCSIGMLTVIWLRIVYTRFETTTGLPIEYGTVQLCSVLGGLLLYQEYTFLDPHQMVLITVGLSIVLLGVAFSSRKTMPECLVGVFDQSVRAVSSIISTKAASDGRGWDDGSGGLAQRTDRRKSLWQWASMKRINKREMVIDAPLAE